MIKILYMAGDIPSEAYKFIEPERAAKGGSKAGAGLLLAYAAYITGNAKKFPLEIIRSADGGKPRIKNSSFEFSLSHTKNLSVCAYSDFPVGVDAEYIRPVNMGLYERFNVPRSDNPEDFIRFWTEYEAGCKLGQPSPAFHTVKYDNYIITAAGTGSAEFTKVTYEQVIDIIGRKI
jgi:hypothetical protein